MKSNLYKNITIPERLYYPLPEVADVLGCSVRDVLHFGATGSLKISVFLDMWQESPKEKLNIFYDGLDSNPEMFLDGDFIGLRGDTWSFTGYIKDEPGLDESMNFVLRNARHIRGFYGVSSQNLIDAEFKYPCDKIRVHTLLATEDFHSYGEVKLHSYAGVMIGLDNFCVMAEDLKKINETKSSIPNLDENVFEESAKTTAKKGELIPQLLKMIPELSDLDFDTAPVKRIIDMIESLAATKGIELSKTDKGTWAKYLGRK